MVESCPEKPLDADLDHFLNIETDLRNRRAEIQSLLNENECIMTMGNFPRLGCPNCVDPPLLHRAKTNIKLAYHDEDFLHPHPR